VGESILGHEVHAPHVDRHHSFPVLLRNLMQHAHMADAGVVEHDVQALVSSGHGVRRGARLARNTDIGAHKHGPPFPTRDPAHGLLGPLLVDVDNPYLRALPREENGGGLADPGRGARD